MFRLGRDVCWVIFCADSYLYIEHLNRSYIHSRIRWVKGHCKRSNNSTHNSWNNPRFEDCLGIVVTCVHSHWNDCSRHRRNQRRHSCQGAKDYRPAGITANGVTDDDRTRHQNCTDRTVIQHGGHEEPHDVEGKADDVAVGHTAAQVHNSLAQKIRRACLRDADEELDQIR